MSGSCARSVSPHCYAKMPSSPSTRLGTDVRKRPLRRLRARGLTIRTYDAAQAAADTATQLRREHKGGALLVVGHSNTVASIAAALCDCEVAPLRDDEFDRWITVRIDANGVATLQTRRY
jgi:TRAP-type uncharacterized transport system substrate-binding protein